MSETLTPASKALSLSSFYLYSCERSQYQAALRNREDRSKEETNKFRKLWTVKGEELENLKNAVKSYLADKGTRTSKKERHLYSFLSEDDSDSESE